MMTEVDGLEFEEFELEYMFQNIREGFEEGDRHIAEFGYSDPEKESQIIIAAIKALDKDLTELEQSPAFSRLAGAEDMGTKLKEEKLKIIRENEMNKAKCSMNVIAHHSQPSDAFFDLCLGDHALGASVWQAAVAYLKLWGKDPEAVDFIEQRKAEQAAKNDQKQTAKRISTKTVVNTSNVPVTTSDEVEAPENTPAPPVLFLGRQDRKTVQRTDSSAPKFSEAARLYIEKREAKKGLPIGASLPREERALIPELTGKAFSRAKIRDLSTTRMRHKLFIELIGDHPIDTYDREDFRTLIHCLQFMTPNFNKRKETSGKDTRSLFLDNWDPETSAPRKPHRDPKAGKLTNCSYRSQNRQEWLCGVYQARIPRI